MEILVTGATGAVGHVLVDALAVAGHSVVAATRRPETYEGPARPLAFDLDGDAPGTPLPDLDPEGVTGGCEAAYYLVHALGDPDFAHVDQRRAERFAHWWGPDRPVIYLGGLGPDNTRSAHLRSRHEIGAHLRSHCRTVELRASLVIGPDSLSFQLLAQLGDLVGHSPVPVPIPSEATTRTQPIAQGDLTRVLVDALDLPPGRYEIGGPDVVTYQELIERSARLQGHDLDAPAVLPLSAEWAAPGVALISGQDPWATSALFAGMGTEAIVHDDRRVPPALRPRTGIDEALSLALASSS